MIAVLPEEDRRRLEPDLVRVSLPRAGLLYRSRAPVDSVYFPIDSIVSVLETVSDDLKVEIATIGNEGVLGAFSILGTGLAIGSGVVQVAGEAWRLDSGKFVRHLAASPCLQRLVHRYMFALVRQIVVAGACSQLHTTEERCARWLLMTHDRCWSDTFALTQEFLAEMLAVRRATVNLALGMLKTAGFIRYVRGQITVVDREGLESAACPCYELIRREYAAVNAD